MKQMLSKMLHMFGYKGAQQNKVNLYELDRQVDQERQLGRLAKSEFIESVFDEVVGGIGKRELPRHENRPR